MKFLRYLLCSFTLAIPTVTCFSQSSVLWEISGNGITSPSYLMGTLKFIGEKEFTIPSEVHTSIGRCKIFAIEDQIDHHAQHELNKAVHFPEGKSLKTELKPEDYGSLVQLFEKEFAVTPAKFEHHYSKLKPLALSMTMTRLSLGEGVRYYDIELVKEAKKKGLETYSLETIEREAEALNGYAIEDQIRALMHSVANFESQKQEFQSMMKEYPHGDLEKILEYTLHPMENNPKFIEEFYSKRNAEWLPKIEKMVHDKAAFIAVGVAHLEGDNGLLNLLKGKGYTLKPVEVTR